MAVNLKDLSVVGYDAPLDYHLGEGFQEDFNRVEGIIFAQQALVIGMADLDVDEIEGSKQRLEEREAFITSSQSERPETKQVCSP